MRRGVDRFRPGGGLVKDVAIISTMFLMLFLLSLLIFLGDLL